MVSVNLSSIKAVHPCKIVGLVDKIFPTCAKFHMEKVNNNIFRSSNVTVNEIPELVRMGIKRVVNLRTLSQQQIEKLQAQYTKFNIDFINIPANLFNFKKSIPVLYNLINENPNIKTLFHCTFGKHRTGGAVALARNILENMPMKNAISDMYQHGFKLKHKICFRSITNSLNAFEQQKLSVKL